jgi:hypothetical protein
MFNKYIPHIIVLFLLIIISLITYIILGADITNLFNTNVSKNSNSSNTNNDKICLSLNEYNKLITANKTIAEKNNEVNNIVEIRDRKVVSDQLYPPLNRTDNKTHEELVKNINTRGMYIQTNDINDKYRLVAYVTNNSEERDAGNNNWKLFARQKDRNISDFYMKPTDNNNDMKVPITDDIVIGDRLRDIYNIPKQLTLNSPLFNKNPYNVVEIPKADLSNSGDYI